jgi:addiction module RelB/DinJ family antitoxin
MSKTSVTFSIDQDVKDAANEVFSNLGLTFTAGLEIYLRTVARKQAIPFRLKLDKDARTFNTQTEEPESLSSRVKTINEVSATIEERKTRKRKQPES